MRCRRFNSCRGHTCATDGEGQDQHGTDRPGRGTGSRTKPVTRGKKHPHLKPASVPRRACGNDGQRSKNRCATRENMTCGNDRGPAQVVRGGLTTGSASTQFRPFCLLNRVDKNATHSTGPRDSTRRTALSRSVGSDGWVLWCRNGAKALVAVRCDTQCASQSPEQ